MNVTLVVAVLGFAFIFLAIMIGHHETLKKAMMASFDDLHFASAHSSAGYFGRELKVLKRSETALFFASRQSSRFGRIPTASDIYWYCKSPDADYFMAMALITDINGKIEIQWVVRSLTEDRMRGALRAFPKAYLVEFGETPAKDPKPHQAKNIVA